MGGTSSKNDKKKSKGKYGQGKSNLDVSNDKMKESKEEEGYEYEYYEEEVDAEDELVVQGSFYNPKDYQKDASNFNSNHVNQSVQAQSQQQQTHVRFEDKPVNNEPDYWSEEEVKKRQQQKIEKAKKNLTKSIKFSKKYYEYVANADMCLTLYNDATWLSDLDKQNRNTTTGGGTQIHEFEDDQHCDTHQVDQNHPTRIDTSGRNGLRFNNSDENQDIRFSSFFGGQPQVQQTNPPSSTSSKIDKKNTLLDCHSGNLNGQVYKSHYSQPNQNSGKPHVTFEESNVMDKATEPRAIGGYLGTGSQQRQQNSNYNNNGESLIKICSLDNSGVEKDFHDQFGSSGKNDSNRTKNMVENYFQSNVNYKVLSDKSVKPEQSNIIEQQQQLQMKQLQQQQQQSQDTQMNSNQANEVNTDEPEGFFITKNSKSSHNQQQNHESDNEYEVEEEQLDFPQLNAPNQRIQNHLLNKYFPSNSNNDHAAAGSRPSQES